MILQDLGFSHLQNFPFPPQQTELSASTSNIKYFNF